MYPFQPRNSRVETTFITMHDLSPESMIFYASESIFDVLGYTPDDVVGHSTWNFFRSSDIGGAMFRHQQAIKMDKASVLVYCDLRNSRGDWVRCECCFSIVYNVLVACTSIYRQDLIGIHRRAHAPIVRRLFTSSPNDPRYHMLQYLSGKFRQPADEQSHEPRAALFLNRFTRTLAIMYATSAIDQIVGISAEEIQGKAFFQCIAQSCLGDAIRCLENAKGNDSIAYLRFLWRDPRTEDEAQESSPPGATGDVGMTDVGDATPDDEPMVTADPQSHGLYHATVETEMDEPSAYHTERNGSASTSNSSTSSSGLISPASSIDVPIELEAVISCTTDGLVVCLRRSRPPVPAIMYNTLPPVATISQTYSGYYAAPWANQPSYHPCPPSGHNSMAYPGMPTLYGGPPPLATHVVPGKIDDQDFLRAIQECGVFAWSLAGINGSVVEEARGEPSGEALPAEGLKIWSPSGRDSSGRGTRSRSSSALADQA